MGQKVVMICDDQKKFRKKFSKDHVNHYKIHKVKDTSNLIDRIKELKKIPDLILLDLYHPKNGKKVPKVIRDKANAALKDLDKQIKVTNKAVLDAWDPLGLDMLKNLRMEFSPEKLPIVIHTQKGLSLLDDTQISTVDEFDSQWLLKKRGYRYTKIRIDRIIHEKEAKRRSTNIYRVIMTILFLAVGYFLSKHVWELDITEKITLEAILFFASVVLNHIIQQISEGKLRW